MNYTLSLKITAQLPLRINKIHFKDINGSVVSASNIIITKGSSSEDINNAFDDNHTIISITPLNLIIEIKFTSNQDIRNVYIDSESVISTSAGIQHVSLLGGLVNINSQTPTLTQGHVYSVVANNLTATPYYSELGLVSSYTTTVFVSGTFVENGKTKYSFTDGEGTYFSYFNTSNLNNEVTAVNFNYYSPVLYSDTNVVNTSVKLKEQSNLANLYEQQAPTVVNIETFPIDDTKTRVVVTTDKNCQALLYVVNQDDLGRETSMRYFARDELASSKVHQYIVDKFTTYSRVVAVPINNSYYKDFFAESPTTGVSSYNYSTYESVVSRYQEGYDTGYKDAHIQVYNQGSPYGWNYDFNTRVDYGSTDVQASFVNSIAEGQYVKAYKELYNRGNAYGFTYNSSSTSPQYYLGLQDSYLSKIVESSTVPVYKSIYSLGAAYGFSYNSDSTDNSYYSNLKGSFISTIDSFSDARGYKRGYSELFQYGRTYQSSKGLPEGVSAWVDVTTTDNNFNQKKEDFIRSIYNTGYIKASQEIYDTGITYGFDWRSAFTVPNVTQSTATDNYKNIQSAYINTVTASSKSQGFKIVYDHAASRYPNFTYNSTNSTNLSNLDYAEYLEGIKSVMLDRVNSASAISAYSDALSTASTNFLYNYNTASTDVNYYKNEVNNALKSAYSYGAIVAYQSVYDRGNSYGFQNASSYGTLKDVRYTPKAAFSTPLVTSLDGLKESFEIRLNENGVVKTYKRFFDLASVYNFTYDSSQTSATYYDNLRESYLSVYSSANLSEGIKFVLDAANVRYDFTYTFTTDADLMKAYVNPMFDKADLTQSLASYNYTLNLGAPYGFTYTEPSTIPQAKALASSLVAHVDNYSGLAAYNYVFNQANTRTGYNLTTSNNQTIAKSKIIPMLKYVEDYKEADGYRRVHNYAKNFLGIGYEFTDSPDPRALENQVPDLFDYLTNNGGTGAYKYIFEQAKLRVNEFNYTYYNGITSTLLKAQVPVMLDTLNEAWSSEPYEYVYNYVNYPYASGDFRELKAQVPAMFSWLSTQANDIASISDPISLPGNRVKFIVTLKRSTSLITVLTDKFTGRPIDFVNNQEAKLVQEVTIKYPGNKNQKFDIMFIPGAKKYTV